MSEQVCIFRSNRIFIGGGFVFLTHIYFRLRNNYFTLLMSVFIFNQKIVVTVFLLGGGVWWQSFPSHNYGNLRNNCFPWFISEYVFNLKE